MVIGAMACSAAADEVQLLTPTGSFSSPCGGDPIALSINPMMLVFACEDGDWKANSSGRLVDIKSPLFIDPIGIHKFEEELDVFGFVGSVNNQKAALVVLRFPSGIVELIPLPRGYDDERIVAAQVDALGECLVLARKTDQLDRFEVSVFRRSHGSRDRVLFEDRPHVSIDSDGHLVSGMGGVVARTVTCAGHGDDISLVYDDRVVGNSGEVRYNLKTKNPSGERSAAMREDRLWPQPHSSADHLAVISRDTGELGLLALSTGELDWSFNADGWVWLAYDATNHSGILLQQAESGWDLVHVTCPGGAARNCERRVVEHDVLGETYVLHSTSAESGFLVYVSKRDSSKDKDVVRQNYRWVY